MSVLARAQITVSVIYDGEPGDPGPIGKMSTMGMVHYQEEASSAPGKPSATNFSFATKTFTNLTDKWGLGAPVYAAGNAKKYWYAYFTVEETASGGGVGVPVFGPVTQAIGFTGLVTFTSADSVSDGEKSLSFGPSGTTEVDGGKITTGTVHADRIDTEGLSAKEVIVGKIKSVATELDDAMRIGTENLFNYSRVGRYQGGAIITGATPVRLNASGGLRGGNFLFVSGYAADYNKEGAVITSKDSLVGCAIDIKDIDNLLIYGQTALTSLTVKYKVDGGSEVEFTEDVEDGNFSFLIKDLSGSELVLGIGGTGSYALSQVMAVHGNKQVAFTLSELDLLARNAQQAEDAANWVTRMVIEGVNTTISNVQDSAISANMAVGALNTYVKGAFRDDVISEGEAVAIEKYINSVNSAKTELDSSYTQLYANTYLKGAPKTNLETAKTAINAATTDLLTAIATAIEDGKTTMAEKADVDAKFALFNTALGVYQTRVEEANVSIQAALLTAAGSDALAKANAARDALAQGAGYENYDDMVEKTDGGNTIIIDGFINTDIIAAKSIKASKIDVESLAADTGFINKLTVRFLETVGDANGYKVTIENSADVEEDGVSSISLSNGEGDCAEIVYSNAEGDEVPIIRVKSATKHCEVKLYPLGMVAEMDADAGLGYAGFASYSPNGVVIGTGTLAAGTARLALLWNPLRGNAIIYNDLLPWQKGEAAKKELYRDSDGLDNPVIRHKS